MTDNTIQATGGDYATPALWEADSDVSSADWRGIISDNSSYTQFTIGEPTGTPSSTNRIILTTASANRHAGVWDTGKARIIRTASGGRTIEVQADWTFLEYLQVAIDTSGDSDECVRYTAGANDEFTMSRCILRCVQSVDGQDCYYQSAVDGTKHHIDNTIFLRSGRGNINIQFSAANNLTVTVNLDNCSGVDGGASGLGASAGQQGGMVTNWTNKTGCVLNVNCYNSYGFLSASAHANSNVFDVHPGGALTVNWAGANNIAGDASAEAKFTTSFDSVALVEASPSSGENVWVTDKDSPWDLSIAGDNAFTVTDNGSDRTGSEGDVEQDFSTDIADTTRSAFTIGAFEFATAAGRTVTCTTEALTLTEQASTVNRQRGVNGGTEVLTLTEQASTVNRVRGVAGATEALTLTENAAVVNRSRGVSGTTEALDLTEQAATVNAARGVTGATEQLALTENAATVARVRNILCGTEALELTENAAGVNRARGVSAATEALELTENAASLNRTRNVAGATEVLTLTELAATVNRQRGVNALTEVLILTESAATVDRGTSTPRIVTCTTEALILTELAASINRTRGVSGQTEALSLTESAATVNASRGVVGATEALQLVENAATVTRVRLIQCSTEALTLTENAASVNATRIVTGGTEVLTLTELAATVNRQRGVTGTTEALTLTESAATLNRTRNVVGLTEVLELVANSATIERGEVIIAAGNIFVVGVDGAIFQVVGGDEVFTAGADSAVFTIN